MVRVTKIGDLYVKKLKYKIVDVITISNKYIVL